MLRGALLCSALGCGLLAGGTGAAAAATASSLDKVPGLIKTPEGKEVFREQMEGRPAPDKLGLHLPAALTAKEIVALLLPGSKAPLNAVGAKPLASHPDLYIALVCTGGDLPAAAYDSRCAQDQSSTAKPRLQVTLGLLTAKPGSPPRRAALPASVDQAVDWDTTNLPGGAPDAPEDAAGKMRPDAIEGFDLAPYQIAPGTEAFGLRASWSEGFSGGMASYTALYLFAVIDGRLRQVFAAPISVYKDIAGDWNKDGTRQHFITDAADILVISRHATDGHFDLLLKNRAHGHRPLLYRWSAAAMAYRRAGT